MFDIAMATRFNAEQPLTQNPKEHAASGPQESPRNSETVAAHDGPLTASMPQALLGTGKLPAGCTPDHTPRSSALA